MSQLHRPLSASYFVADLSAGLIIIFALLFVCGCNNHHPSDVTLIDNFNNHRQEFEHLRQMFQADTGLVRVGDGFTRPNDVSKIGLDEKKITEYHRIFEDINLRDGIEGYDDKDIIWFHASSLGLSIGGSSKGYVYSIDPSSHGTIVGDIDTFRPQVKKSFTVFRHIEGKWYLYLDCED